MNHRLITILLASAMSALMSIATLAQDRIDKEVARLEKDPNIDVTFTERRDPKTKKLVKQSLILNGKMKAQADKLWQACEDERPNSVAVTKQKNTYIIKFEDNKYTSSYVLTVRDNGWSLVVTKREPGADGFSYNDGYDNMAMDDRCQKLEQSIEQKVAYVAELDLDGNVKYLLSDGDTRWVPEYDSNGELLYYRDTDGNVMIPDKPASPAVKQSSTKTKSVKTSKSTSKSSSKSGYKTRTVTVIDSNGKRTIESSVKTSVAEALRQI